MVESNPTQVDVAAQNQAEDTDYPFHFVLGNREIVIVETAASEVVHFYFEGIGLFFEIHYVPVTVLAYECAV